MKIYTFLLVALAAVVMAFTPTFEGTPRTVLQGTWQHIGMEKGAQVTQVLLFSGDYFSWTEYKTDSGEFLLTKGGSWRTNGTQLQLVFEFNTMDSTQVGETESWTIHLKGEQMQLSHNVVARNVMWENIDKGVATPLTGAWLMAGRKTDGEISRRDVTRSRKTMKILTGTHFQWIAFDTETKRFSGTGGGTYTAEDGKYVENIAFFSRDNSRVGASLAFNFAIVDGEWHHSGKSSKGDPIYEIWAPRK